jgi:ADP-heptose:LPS heptosyltransferase
MAEASRILVIKLGALGDFIQALGPMAAIRQHHPQAHITLLTTAPFADFGRQCGYFDEIWVDSKPRLTDIRGWLKLRRRLNSGGFTRVYDLQNNDRAAFYLRLFSPKPEWVGAARGASHRNASAERPAGQAFDGHVQTLALAGIENIRIDSMEWVEGDAAKFGVKKPYVLLVPGAAPQHESKRWPAAHYGALVKILDAKRFQPVIIGGKDEAAAAAEILKIHGGCIDLTGKTSLSDIVLLARNAAGAVGNDTGPMHLIAPTGCPSLVLFSGASNPVRHAPKGPAVVCLQENELKDLDVQKAADQLLTLLIS